MENTLNNPIIFFNNEGVFITSDLQWIDFKDGDENWYYTQKRIKEKQETLNKHFPTQDKSHIWDYVDLQTVKEWKSFQKIFGNVVE